MKKEDSQCFNECPGDKGQICGAGWQRQTGGLRMSLYKIDGCILLNQNDKEHEGAAFYFVGEKA